LDFVDALEVLESSLFTTIDRRRDYGEMREICFGMLRGTVVMIGFTRRGNTFHVFTMRKANARERANLDLHPGC
jgi:uncharacterized DUF497 family protein